MPRARHEVQSEAARQEALVKVTANTCTDEQAERVACPWCLVQAGTRCTNMNRSGYKPIRREHLARRARAAALINEQILGGKP